MLRISSDAEMLNLYHLMRLRCFIATITMLAPLLLSTTFAFAGQPNQLGFHLGHGAARLPNETYQDIRRERAWLAGTLSTSVESASVAWQDLQTDSVPAWTKSSDDLTDAFRKLRDLRFLTDSRRATFSRRVPWLYPDDGCFNRAERMSLLLQQWGFPAPAKIFAFGDLVVQTENHPSKQVTWWYHVVAGYVVGKRLMVLDPAIESSQPIEFKDWIDRMSAHGSRSVTASACSSEAYTPDSSCVDAKAIDLSQLESEQVEYLDDEWSRMTTLGRDPQKVLGDQPPWLTPVVPPQP